MHCHDMLSLLCNCTIPLPPPRSQADSSPDLKHPQVMSTGGQAWRHLFTTPSPYGHHAGHENPLLLQPNSSSKLLCLIRPWDLSATGACPCKSQPLQKLPASERLSMVIIVAFPSSISIVTLSEFTEFAGPLFAPHDRWLA
jgi:hypothetical protein